MNFRLTKVFTMFMLYYNHDKLIEQWWNIPYFVVLVPLGGSFKVITRLVVQIPPYCSQVMTARWITTRSRNSDTEVSIVLRLPKQWLCVTADFDITATQATTTVYITLLLFYRNFYSNNFFMGKKPRQICHCPNTDFVLLI